jgi:signal peptidase II
MDISPPASAPSARDGAAGGTSGWGWYLGLAVAAAIIDLVSKAVLFARLGMPGEQAPIVLVPGMLTFETNLNEGALFGMGQGMGMVFAAVSCAAIAGILWMVSRRETRDDRWLLTALALITGGIIGNLWDRLGIPALRWHAPPERLGTPVLAVRDWIHFKLDGVIDWPIFNLADTWLVIGASVLLLVTWRSPSASAFAAPDEPPDHD